MNNMNDNLSDKLSKAPRLSLGRNKCSACSKEFVVEEHQLEMPGTQDLESVNCPYCNAYNGEVFINGTVLTRKIED